MKKKVKINFKVGSKVPMTPKLFFRQMPYMLDHFNFELSKNPDYLIYTHGVHKGKYKKIWYTHENVRPPKDLKGCDWALSFDYNRGKNHFRFPNYVRIGCGKNLLKKSINVKNVFKSKKKFCAFIYAHDVPLRNKFFDMLSKYKKVDAPGRCRHNVPMIGNYKNAGASRSSSRFNDEKLAYIKPYKFVIAFEHSSYPGYTTEKVYHPFVVNSVPIYWGNPQVGNDFNTKRFISVGERRGLSKQAQLQYLVDKVVEIDKKPKLYMKMLKEPCYPNNKIPAWANPNKIIQFFERVFSS